MSERGIAQIFRNSFRRNIAVTYSVLFSCLCGLLAIYTSSRVTETRQHALTFLKRNQDYLLALALYENTEAINLFLQRASDTQRALSYRYDPKPSSLPKGNAMPLELGNKVFGVVTYRVKWPALIEPQIPIIFCLGALGVFLLTFRFYRKTSSFIQTNLAEPLDRISTIARQSTYMTELAQVGQVPSGIDEVLQIRNSLVEAAHEIQDAQARLKEAEFAMRMSELAAHVSHDIRSPLAALDVVLGGEGELTHDKKRIATAALDRIRSIANELLEKHREYRLQAQSTLSESDVARMSNFTLQITERIVAEKRWELRSHVDLKINFVPLAGCCECFSSVNPMEFQRVVSNLINNAVEALPDNGGTITISVGKSGDQSHFVSIHDTGKGMPLEVLNRLGQKGFSFGKESSSSGSGLGVYHAKRCAEAWGGSLEFQSKPGEGTCAKLNLVTSPAPGWIAKEIVFPPNGDVVALDDDATRREMWQEQFQRAGLSVDRLVFLREISEFELWIKNHFAHQAREQTTFLVDYHLGNRELNGVDLIRKYSLADRAYLVTSAYGDESLQKICLNEGIRMVPKGLEGFFDLATCGSKIGHVSNMGHLEQTVPSFSSSDKDGNHLVYGLQNKQKTKGA